MLLYPIHVQFVLRLQQGNNNSRPRFRLCLLHKIMEEFEFLCRVVWPDETTFKSEYSPQPRGMATVKFSCHSTLLISNRDLTSLGRSQKWLPNWVTCRRQSIVEVESSITVRLKEHSYISLNACEGTQFLYECLLNMLHTKYAMGRTTYLSGPMFWPLRSPDLIPLDLFLCYA